MEREEIKPKSYPTNLLQKNWNERKTYFRKGSTEYLSMVHDLEVKDDDVWLVTLPKCGTTWMQELVWLVMNNFDFEAAKSEHLEVRTPFLEFDYMVYHDLNRAFKPIENLKSPRLIKSHLCLPLLPAQLWHKKPKTIYVYRNPKDALVSEYYHGKSLGRCALQSIEDYIIDEIERSSLEYQPFEHVTEFYALRNEPWVFYTSYERMKSNLREVILDVCKFLNKSINDEQMKKMLHHLSFEEMKNNPYTNHIWEFTQVRAIIKQPFEEHNFVRRGKVDGYKDELSFECIKKIDAWIERELKRYNLTMDELLLLNDTNGNYKNGSNMI